MSALPKAANAADATLPPAQAAALDDQARVADGHSGVRSDDLAACNGDPDCRDAHPDGEGGDPEARKSNPDDRTPRPDVNDGNPVAATPDPDADESHPGVTSDGLHQASRRRRAAVERLEPTGWAEMPIGPQAQILVSGTDIESITVRTTARAKDKKVTERRPKAPPTPPGGAGGDGDVPPSQVPANDEAPSGPESRKPRTEFSIPPGVGDAFRAAAGMVRDQLVEDPDGREGLVKAVSCVATKANWRAIAAKACDLTTADDKTEQACRELLALALDGHYDAINRVGHFASRLRKDPAAVVEWYDVASDACLLTLGDRVLRRGGLTQRVLQRLFPTLRWKEAANRRATRDKEAKAKAGRAA